MRSPASEAIRGSAASSLPILLVSCLLFAYVALRAARLPITWDEAYNYLEFTRQGALVPHRLSGMAANNHFLNTWLTYVTTGLLGVSELTLRVPVLGAYLLFLYYTARLSHALSWPPLRTAGFVILNVNPYAVDFFSLSRGYGIGYGLLAGSLWYLYRFLERDLDPRYSRISLGLAALAVTAHLTLIHFLVSLAAVLVLATALLAPAGTAFLPRVRDALRLHAPDLVGVALLCLPLVFLMRAFRRSHALFYGGETSLWHDTLVGAVERALYGKDYGAMLGSIGGVLPDASAVLGWLALMLIAIAAAVSLRCIARRRYPRDLYLPALVFLLCSCALATVVQHHLLGVPYLTGRTALYLVLLGTLVAVWLADTIARRHRLWRYALPAAALVMAVHFVNCMNLAYVLEWKVEADVKRMIADVAGAKDTMPPAGPTTTLGPNLEFEAPINFYRLVDGLTWLNVADRRMKLHPLSDFYLFTEDDWRAVDADSFTVLKRYPLTGNLLARRRQRPSHYEVRFDRTLDFEGDGGHRRSGGIRYCPDLARDIPDRSLIAISAKVWMESLRNATARLVVEFERDRRGSVWQGLTVRDDATGAKTWFPVSLTAFVPADLQPGDRLSVYLTNRRTPVYIDALRVRWLTAAERTDSARSRTPAAATAPRGACAS